MAHDQPLDQSPYSVGARPRLVILAMHSVVARYSDPKICIYPLLDALHLLVPKPIVLSFLLEEPNKVFRHRFSTIRDQSLVDHLIEWIHLQPSEELVQRLIRVPKSEPNKKPLWMLISKRIDGELHLSPYAPCVERSLGHESDEKTDFWLFERVFAQLESNSSDPLSKHTIEVLNDAPPRPYHNPSVGSSVGTGLPMIEFRNRIINTIRGMLDEAWTEISGSLLLQTTESACSVTNLFPVARFALQSDIRKVDVEHEYDFSAQLIIPSGPRDKMVQFLTAVSQGQEEFRDEEWLSAREKMELFKARFDSDAHSVLAALERPLEINDSSIADTVFLSGQMDYLAARFTQSARNEKQSDRAAAEILLLGEHGQQLSYIPVHVGGVPWIAIFSMNTDEGEIDARSWRHNFHLYHTFIPTFAASIRRAAHNAYRKEIVRSVTTWLSSPKGQMRASINEELRALCTYFPFFLLQIGGREGASAKNQALDSAGVDVKLLPNPNSAFSDPLPFDLYTQQEANDAYQEAHRAHDRKMLETSRRSAMTWAHEISNAVLPAFSALHRSAGRNENPDHDLRNAMHWLLCMGATAQVRNSIGKHIERTGSVDSPTPEGQALLSLPEDIRRDVIENVLIFLLRSHARLRRTDFVLKVNGREIVENEKSDEAEIRALRHIVTTYGKADDKLADSDIAVIYSPVVSWPFALLRELVQNIRLKNPPNRIGQPSLEFSYEWIENMVGGRPALRLWQRQLEDRKWEERLQYELPDGIIRANLVYGRLGAGFGEIKLVGLSQEEISNSGIIRIDYKLDVIFLGGEDVATQTRGHVH